MRIRARLLLLSLAVFSACGTTGPASLEFVEISPLQPRLGEVVTVRFKATDSRGVPQAGADLVFKLDAPKAGVTLSPLTNTTQKGTGIAETQLVANSRVNSVSVIASSGDKTVASPPITFAGSQPNGRQFTFQCGEMAGDASGGRHAIGAFDQTRNLIAGVKLNCTAHVGDRNGDGVPNALVSFEVEAGTIGPTETSLSNVVGNASVLYKTSYPVPEDVAPDRFVWTPSRDLTHTGEFIAPLWMHPYEWVPNPMQYPRPPANANPNEPSRIDPIRRSTIDGSQVRNNPRDNLVTMIAVTAGEEGFTDTDNDGKYTDGEPFDDLPEPFVDSNDNGTWDPDEKFIDLNGNRQWDGKNGKWDGNTLIWVQERILWTGLPAYEDTLPPSPVLNPVSPTPIALTCPGTGQCSQAGPPADVHSLLADPWYNTIAQNSDGDGCTIPVDDGSPIKTSPKIVNQGSKITYPAGDVIEFVIRDARDPLAAPADQIPKRVPAIDFTQAVFCTFTSSPISGMVVTVPIGTIRGTIE